MLTEVSGGITVSFPDTPAVRSVLSYVMAMCGDKAQDAFYDSEDGVK